MTSSRYDVIKYQSCSKRVEQGIDRLVLLYTSQICPIQMSRSYGSLKKLCFTILVIIIIILLEYNPPKPFMSQVSFIDHHDGSHPDITVCKNFSSHTQGSAVMGVKPQNKIFFRAIPFKIRIHNAYRCTNNITKSTFVKSQVT